MPAPPRPHVARLGYVVIPIGCLPIIVPLLPETQLRFFLTFVSIALAAPVAGFWWGEMKGTVGPTRAGLGCLGTLGFFFVYLGWAFAIVPRFLDKN